MYPIYCGHQVIEKRMTVTGDLVVNCVSCHSTNMWNQGSVPSNLFQTPPPKLVGVFKTGLFAVPLEKPIHQPTKEDFRKNIVRYSLEQKFSIYPTKAEDLKKGDI